MLAAELNLCRNGSRVASTMSWRHVHRPSVKAVGLQFKTCCALQSGPLPSSSRVMQHALVCTTAQPRSLMSQPLPSFAQ